MAFTIFLCGHGSYKPSNGFFSLPKGSSMEFIVHHAKLLPTDDMYKVCGGTYTNSSDRTIGEYQQCPNMSWTQDDPAKIQICKDRLQNNTKVGTACNVFPNDISTLLDNTGTITLKKFFTDYAEEFRKLTQTHGSLAFVWNCCSHLDLKASKRGADIGINAGQGHDSYTHLDLTNGLAPSGKVTKF